MPIPARAYAAYSPTTPLAPFDFMRREVGSHDVRIEILYCGVCHSDLHTARNEWHHTLYPVVPGHEIVGRVVEVGGDVTSFTVGEQAGVGCMVDSCRSCPECKEGLEQYCQEQTIFTYNSPDIHTGGLTYGGYSNTIVVDEAFCLHIRNQPDLAPVAPLLCAGITTYSPLKHWRIGKGDVVGIVGLGGLGHMGVKFAHAFGAHTVLFTTTPAKAQDALRLGADEVVITNDPTELAKHSRRFHFILDTVGASHRFDTYLELVKRDGTMCLVGLPEEAGPAVHPGILIAERRRLSGSGIGGIAETQEMLDFCAEHKIISDIEIIPISQINTAYERMLKSEVRYRFVIDMASLK